MSNSNMTKREREWDGGEGVGMENLTVAWRNLFDLSGFEMIGKVSFLLKCNFWKNKIYIFVKETERYKNG